MVTTITWSPPATTQFYVGQIVAWTVLIETDGGPDTIPAGAHLSFSGSGWRPMPDNNYAQNAIPILPDRTDPTGQTKGRAIFYGMIETGTPTIGATVANWPGGGISQPTIPAGPAYAAASVATLAVSSPTIAPSFYVPTAPDDNQLPASSPTNHTITMSVTVTEKGKTAGIPNLVVNWSESSSVTGTALFSEKLRTFLKTDEKRPLGPQDFELVGSSESQSVRVETDASGVATIYLVAKTVQIGASLSVSAFPLAAVGTHDFVVAHVWQWDIIQTASPAGLDGTNLPLGQFLTGLIPVAVQAYNNAIPSDKIHLLLRVPATTGPVKWEDQFLWGQRSAMPYQSELNSTDLASDGTTQNELRFLVVTTEGDVYVSQGFTFTATGSQIPTPPPDGKLDAPKVPNTGSLITYGLMQSGTLPLRVPIPYAAGRDATVGDTVYVYGYIAGWQNGSPNETHPIVTGHGTVDANDKINGYIDVGIPSPGLTNWSQGPGGYDSTVVFMYSVGKPLSDPSMTPDNYSKLSQTYTLRTIPR